MVQVSRWHNFSPAMKKKNHRAPQGLKEKEGKSEAGLGTSLEPLLKLYCQQTLGAEKYSKGLWSNNWK